MAAPRTKFRTQLGHVASAPIDPVSPASVRDATTARVALLTVLDVAELLRTTPKAVYHLVEARRIPHIKLGRSVRFTRADVLAWIERNRVPSLESR